MVSSTEKNLIGEFKMELLNGIQLAVKLGCSEYYVSAMRQAGLPFFCGKITLKDAMQWMRDHPHFKSTDVYQKKFRKSSAKQQRKKPSPRSLIADKLDEQLSMHDQRNASPSPQPLQLVPVA